MILKEKYEKKILIVIISSKLINFLNHEVHGLSEIAMHVFLGA